MTITLLKYRLFSLLPSWLQKYLAGLPQRDICNTCRKEYTDLDNIDFINHVGECAMCDHVRGDL